METSEPINHNFLSCGHKQIHRLRMQSRQKKRRATKSTVSTQHCGFGVKKHVKYTIWVNWDYSKICNEPRMQTPRLHCDTSCLPRMQSCVHVTHTKKIACTSAQNTCGWGKTPPYVWGKTPPRGRLTPHQGASYPMVCIDNLLQTVYFLLQLWL